MGRPKKTEQISKEELLDAALEEFSQKGYHQTKLDDIALRCSVSRGAIYWHFQDKQDLFVQLVRSNMGEIEKQFIEIASRKITAFEKLEALFLIYFSTLLSSSKFQKIKRLELRKTETWENLEVLRKEHQEKIEFWVKEISAIFSLGIRAGEFHQNTDPLGMAKMFIFSLIGIEDMWLFEYGKFDLMEHAKMTIRVMLKGIC